MNVNDFREIGVFVEVGGDVHLDILECDRCGALVAFSGIHRHKDWHNEVDA